MGIRADTSSKNGKVFSEDVLKIEICGPGEDYLTVIDVPGIFRTPTEGITTKKDIELVQNMVKEYIKDSRTIILAVLPSNVDIATQEILTLAQDYDKAGERTLGVLTKPDLVKEHSAIVAVTNLVLGKKKPLTLGYYVVRNRGADDDDTFDHAANEEMFRQEPWSRVPKDRTGVQALKTRLGELLVQITRREFPKLRTDIKSQLVDCRRDLESLGPARQTEQEQRLFLNAITNQFQRLVEAALNAHYHNHAAFEEQEELRLITHVVNLTEMFNYDFEKKGQLRYFESLESSPANGNGKECPSDKSKKEDIADDIGAMQKLVEKIDIKDSVLENIITKDCHFDSPKPGIMNWIEGLYVRSRGVEMGSTVGGPMLSNAFKEQSKKWSRITEAYVSHVIVVIHRFMLIALKKLCSDARVHEEIWSSIADEVLSRYKAAMNQAMFLVSSERDQRPYTLNGYFNENLQRLRVAKLEGKARIEKVNDHYSTNLVVDLDLLKIEKIDRSNVEHAKEEIHDILSSYYEVARKRFVDNVYHQAIDHYLLTGPMSPLAVFSQEWVITLEAEQLEAIAGELPVTKEQRGALVKKINDLETALRILQKN
jgi:Dynamin central region/Dynamin family